MEWEVSPDLQLGVDYVLLPKPLWDLMGDWYGGGPVFCRQVVRVSKSTLTLTGRAKAGTGPDDTADTSRR